MSRGFAVGTVVALFVVSSVLRDTREDVDRLYARLDRIEATTTTSGVVRSAANPPPPTTRAPCTAACVGVLTDGGCVHMDPASAAERGLRADPECVR